MSNGGNYSDTWHGLSLLNYERASTSLTVVTSKPGQQVEEGISVMKVYGCRRINAHFNHYPIP